MVRNEQLNIHVFCDTCRADLVTILEKKTGYDFELCVEPCSQCIAEEPEEEIISLTLNLNNSERENIEL